MLAIFYLMFYNFCRFPMTLRDTPAMEPRLTDDVWTLEGLVRLIEPKSILGGIHSSRTV
jgi:hypothetical protein